MVESIPKFNPLELTSCWRLVTAKELRAPELFSEATSQDKLNVCRYYRSKFIIESFFHGCRKCTAFDKERNCQSTEYIIIIITIIIIIIIIIIIRAQWVWER
jgi:hypothetical protein